MPEYLSPGVSIEEVPSRIKAIEGVSTSTAGLVGDCERGPIPGWTPLAPAPVAPQFFDLPSDLAPPLVTSFAQYQRQFGTPTSDPANFGYLGHATKAFFDNGGKRGYIVRVQRGGSAPSESPALPTGTLYRFLRRASAADTVLHLNSVRGLDATTTIDVMSTDGSTLAGNLAIASTNTRQGTVRLAAQVGVDVNPATTFVQVNGAALGAQGPVFFARNPGTWGDALRVTVLCSDRPPVAITQAAAAGVSTLMVRSTAGFYVGALIEIDHDATAVTGGTTREQCVVSDIGPGTALQLSTPLVTAATATGIVRVLEIDVLVQNSDTQEVETFRGLSWNAAPNAELRRRHYSTVVNRRSTMVWVQPSWATGAATEDPPSLANQPITNMGAALALANGDNGAAPTDADVEGNDPGPGLRTGIQALQDVDDVRLIAAPGLTSVVVQNALITQCERMRYRFAILDCERDLNPSSVVTGVLAHRSAYSTSFASYYFPWVQAAVNGATVALPPSGHVMGICARVDSERGVHKAPANEVVRSTTGLVAYATSGEQDILNPRGVNVIRRFEGRGTRVWGARTLSDDSDFRYTNVRRTMIFLSASIDRGTQWVVFEPNSPPTWARVVDSVSAFLHTMWRDGALMGRRPEDAFYVRCDESTMAADDVLNGRLVCLIGVAIVRPAEFVIFRIEQLTGFPQ